MAVNASCRGIKEREWCVCFTSGVADIHLVGHRCAGAPPAQRGHRIFADGIEQCSLLPVIDGWGGPPPPPITVTTGGPENHKCSFVGFPRSSRPSSSAALLDVVFQEPHSELIELFDRGENKVW